MERADSHPSIETLIRVHETLEDYEDRQRANAALDDEDDATPRPSAIGIGPRVPLASAHPNITVSAHEEEDHHETPIASPISSIRPSLHGQDTSPVPSFPTTGPNSPSNRTGKSLPYVSAPASTKRPDLSSLRSMSRYKLYETRHRFYIVGTNTSETLQRLLRIERTVDQEELVLQDENIVYTKAEMDKTLASLEGASKATGGFLRKCAFFGIAGECVISLYCIWALYL